MSKQILTLLFLIVLTAVLCSMDYYFLDIDIQKMTQTLTTITIAYAFFKVFLGEFTIKHVRNKKSRYVLRKTISYLFVLVSVLLILRLWVTDATALVAAYGFIAAAVAFAIQDFFKNFVGGLVVMFKDFYKVGDRITIDSASGDVIDIDLLYTELLEIQNWVSGDQPTGRIVSVPNGKILSKDVFNSTRDHSFIWDELHIPIPYGGNWKQAVEIIEKIILEKTGDVREVADKEIAKLHAKYFLSVANTESKTFIKLTDNWISIYGRYVCYARERRALNSDIMQAILEEFEVHKIDIASTTSVVSYEQNS